MCCVCLCMMIVSLLWHCDSVYDWGIWWLMIIQQLDKSWQEYLCGHWFIYGLWLVYVGLEYVYISYLFSLHISQGPYIENFRRKAL